MPWQVLIAAYLVFVTVSYLLRRKLAKTFSEYQQLVNFVFFLMFLYPMGLIVALFVPHNLTIGWLNLFILLGGSLVFPIVNLLAYKANKELDVGLFSVLANLYPVITIAGATIFLHEGLNSLQLIGAALLIVSGVAIGLPNVNLKKVSKAHADAVWVTVLAVVLLGMGIVFERFMLKRMDFGAYLVFGWGGQTLWAVLIALRKKLDLSPLKEWDTGKGVLAYGLTNTLKALCFLAALRLGGNASLVSASTNFSAVLIVIAAYIFLKEKDAMLLKVAAAVVSSIGLMLL